MTIWQHIGPLQIAIVCLAHLPPSQTSPTHWPRSRPRRRHCDIARAMRNRMSCVPPSQSQPPSKLDTSPKRERVSALASPLQIYWQDPRWIYSLFTTIDANFRLKNKSRGIHNDPPLGDGWGHWVPEIPYKDYLSEYGYQTEVRWLTFYDCMINLCV